MVVSIRSCVREGSELVRARLDFSYPPNEWGHTTDYLGRRLTKGDQPPSGSRWSCDVAACFQHPDREAEITLRFYENGGLVAFSLCHTCRHALDIAALVYEGLIPLDYEIIDIDESGVTE